MFLDAPSRGRIASLQRSKGGVPKLPIDSAQVTREGLEGDWQQNRRHHGGPDRALCLYSLELIQALAAEGHPIVPGAVGENVTIQGVDWRLMQPGADVRLGEVELELTAFAVPCRTISGAFMEGRSVRIGEKLYPGWSRVYARVVKGGFLSVGDEVEVVGLL